MRGVIEIFTRILYRPGLLKGAFTRYAQLIFITATERMQFKNQYNYIYCTTIKDFITAM